MDSTNTQSKSPSLASRLGRFLVRLILVLIFGVLLGVGLYFGIPALYRQFIQPVQEHTLQINILETQQAQADARTDQQINALLARLESLELQSDANKGSITDIQANQESLSTARGTLSVEVTALQTSVASNATTMEEHRADLEQLQTDLGTLEADLNKAIELLSKSLEELDLNIQKMEASQDGIVSTTVLQNELQILRLMDLITRARYFLFQNNVGLAVRDIQSGVGILTDLLEKSPNDQAPALSETLVYLNGALADLPENQALADTRLEVAWWILMTGSSKGILTPEPVAGTPSPTITPTSTEVTPTPGP